MGKSDDTLEFIDGMAEAKADSQALSLGAQFVPRARVTQLMLEWHLEKHRTPIEQKMKEGGFQRDVDGNQIYFAPKSTERIFLIGMAWVAQTIPGKMAARAWSGDATFPEFGAPVRRLVVITSRLNIAILKVEDRDSAEVPTKDEIGVVAFRNLSRVQRVVTHPRLRQFLGFMWDESAPDAFSEAFFFESYYRRRDFLDAVRLVHKFRPRFDRCDPSELDNQVLMPDKVNKGHIVESLLKQEMLWSLRKTCKPRENPRAEAQLVTVAFIKSEVGITRDWIPSIDALVMTRDALCVVGIQTFLDYWAKSETNREYRNAEDDDDSDSDLDGIPSPEPGDPTDMDGITPPKGEPIRGGSAWSLKSLSGVWFLADPEPKVALQFGKKETIAFFSDGDRQRFRQHLACALRLDDEGGNENMQAQVEQGKMWKVKPTGKVELGEVTKEVREIEVQIAKHVDHVKKMAQLALGNG